MGSFKLGKMTLGGLFKKPETLMYPVETKTPPAGLKGHVVNDVDRCILCGICQKRCPCAAIVVDKPARTWTIDRFRCVQCGQVRAYGSLSLDKSVHEPNERARGELSGRRRARCAGEWKSR